MPDARRGPKVYAIAAHRGFADALATGLLSRYMQGDGKSDTGLARLTLLLPSRRAVRNVTEAFVRAGGGVRGDRGADGAMKSGGLLLPRMVVVNDLDLDQAFMLDPLSAGEDIPPAVDPVWRWLRLAELIRMEEAGDDSRHGAIWLRRAREAAAILDRLAIEAITAEALLADEVLALVGEQAEHWIASTRHFLRLNARWQAELAARGQIDPLTRRNRLFARAAESWAASPPPHPVIAAGITSASPALAKLLRVVSELPKGAVVLPDLDLALEEDVWQGLGDAGIAPKPGEAPFGREDAQTHPQYHLKLLLNRMGVARGEVGIWRRTGLADSGLTHSGPEPTRAERSRAISSLFLPPTASACWADLPESRRRLDGVRLMESAHPGEEAQAIALLMREALETPQKRVALVTPDRALAARVIAHLRRWGIEADDTAGQPLPQTAAGRVILLLAEVMGEEAPPVPLIALLSHPLVRGAASFGGEARAAWLEHVRRFALGLSGPRPDAGLAPLRALAGRLTGTRHGKELAAWWAEVEEILTPLFPVPEEAPGEAPLADQLRALARAGEALCGEALWNGADGRALSGFLDELTVAAGETGTLLTRRELAAALRDAMEEVAVRPPWGGHPRVAIYGLIEARMVRADLTICGGLVETVWPARPAPDPLLPPAVLRLLGVPSGEFRIGLDAHDLAAALGARQVVLSWARRDDGGPVIPSRFVLRVQAMLGAELAARHRETRAIELARAIDRHDRAEAYPRPRPMPSAEQRRVAISVTGLDRLRGDPYQFYASAILGLRRLDPLDAEPSPAWRGDAVHAILDAWHKEGAPPGRLCTMADRVLDEMSAHPLSRALWRPRLRSGLAWIDARIAALAAEGRQVLTTETRGEMRYHGVRIHGRADRIDRLNDGTLAIVDYKTGQPPSARQVEEGFALQLGLIGLIARAGGFAHVTGEPACFEYWSLSRDRKRDGFGWCEEPFRTDKRKNGPLREEFLTMTEAYLQDAIARWILGNEPFTARLNPDLGGYNDYDQLMRLDEWLGLQGPQTGGDRA